MRSTERCDRLGATHAAESALRIGDSMSTEKRGPARLGIEQRATAAGSQQYRARVFDKVSQRQLRSPWTGSLAEARAWRVDALAQLQAGILSGDRGYTVREAVTVFLAGVQDGTIRTRSGHRYQGSTVRGYKRELQERIQPAFGSARLGEVTLPDCQRWADELAGQGLAPSTIRNVVTAFRALYSWALPRGHARVNPTRGLRLPTGAVTRDRIATPSEAATLIAAVDQLDRAALGLAVYGGLRLGEIIALEWSAIDLAAGTLRVERSWDHSELAFIKPKSRAGSRTVPITVRLAGLLGNHAVLTNQRAGLLFPNRRGELDRPMNASGLTHRMAARWAALGLTPLGMHEARHTFASLMIAAGANAKSIATYMGHADIATTFDRYGHLMPGNEAEAAGLLDAYLERFDG